MLCQNSSLKNFFTILFIVLESRNYCEFAKASLFEEKRPYNQSCIYPVELPMEEPILN